MALNPLLKLLQQRRIAADEAKRALGTYIQAELYAEQEFLAALAAIKYETDFAANVASADAVVEDFARWLPAAQERVLFAEADLAALRTQTSEARALLALAQGALRAAEGLADHLIEAAAAGRNRQEQRELDELGGRRFVLGPPPGNSREDFTDAGSI